MGLDGKRTHWAECGLIFVTIFWGTAFVVVKNTTGSIPPAGIIVVRYGIATLLLCAFFFRRLKKIDRPCILGGLLIGALNFIGMQLQTVGVQYTTVGKNAFLTAAYCVIVPFLYWIVRRKRPTVSNLVSAFVCIVGIGLISLRGGFSVGFGDLLSLSCGLAFAAQIVAISILTEKSDPILLSLIQSAATTVFALPFALAEGIPARISADSVLSLLYLGVFCTMAASVGQLACQKYTPPAQASLIMSLESVFGTLSGIVFLHEAVTPRLFAGFALIFSAVLLSVLNPSSFPFRKRAARSRAPLQKGGGGA